MGTIKKIFGFTITAIGLILIITDIIFLIYGPIFIGFLIYGLILIVLGIIFIIFSEDESKIEKRKDIKIKKP